MAQQGGGPGEPGGPGRRDPARPQDAADARPTAAAPPRPRLTSRAAVLAVVVCAITLSLAYPVREYIAQRQQIDQLTAQHQSEEAQVRSLQAEAQRLAEPGYVEQQARDRLNMCMPSQTCYVIIGDQSGGGRPQRAAAPRSPWYVTLWQSVKQADRQGPR